MKTSFNGSRGKNKGLVSAFALIFLTIMATSFGLSLLTAAVLMFGLSLLHEGMPIVPALGFWESFGAMIVLSLVGAMFRGASATVKPTND